MVPGPSGAISWALPSKKKSPSPRVRATGLSGWVPVAASGPALCFRILPRLLGNLIRRHAVAPCFVLQRADLCHDVLALLLRALLVQRRQLGLQCQDPILILLRVLVSFGGRGRLGVCRLLVCC